MTPTSLTIEQVIEELTDIGEKYGYDLTLWIEDSDGIGLRSIKFFSLGSRGDEDGVEIKSERI